MQRKNNYKQGFNFFKNKKQNYQNNNINRGNLEKVKEDNISINENKNIVDNQNCANLKNIDSLEINKEFTISYKNKNYIYEIPEQILQKEINSLPFWLLPIHVKLIPNGMDLLAFCEEISNSLSKTGARIEIDNQSGDIKKKIKIAELNGIPYIIIIGPKERSIHKFIVRTNNGNQKLLSVGAFSHILFEQLLNKPRTIDKI